MGRDIERRSLIIIFITLTLLMIALYANCRPNQKEVTSQTLTFSLPPDEVAGWRELSNRFEQENPGVHIEINEAPKSASSRETLITTSLLSGSDSEDLFYLDIVWTPKFAAAGWLEDLSDLFNEQEWQDFLTADLTASKYKGRIYRLPLRSDAGLLYYRKDLLEQAGLAPPKTFQELKEIAQKLQKPPQLWGYVWQGKQYEGLVCNYLEILSGMGGFWIDANTNKVGLDQAPAIDALNFLQATINDAQISPPGVTSYEEEEGRQLFQQGAVIFHRNWPYAWSLFQRDDSPIKGKVGVQPMVHGGNAQSAATLGGWGLAISRYSVHKELAKKFLRFMASAPIQEKFILDNSFVPVRHSLYKNEQILTKFPFYRDLYQVELSGVPRPPVPQYAAISDILQRYVSSALAHQLTPSDALNRAAKETRGRVE